MHLHRRADIEKLNALSNNKGIFVCMDTLNWGLQTTDKVVSDNHYVPILNMTIDKDMMADLDVVINSKGTIARFNLSLQDCSAIAPDFKVSTETNKLFLQSISDDKETINLICTYNKEMADILRSRYVQVTDIAIGLWNFYFDSGKDE